MKGDERPEIELARDLVAILAPGEQPLFSAIKRAFEADRDGKGLFRSGGDDILGFGMTEAATLLTPVALMAAKEVVEYIGMEIGKGLVKEAVSEVMTRVRGLIRRDTSSERLDPAQLTRVRLIAENVALKAKLPKARAVMLADAMVQRLGQH